MVFLHLLTGVFPVKTALLYLIGIIDLFSMSRFPRPLGVANNEINERHNSCPFTAFIQKRVFVAKLLGRKE